MNIPEDLRPLAWFFTIHPHWFLRVCDSQNQLNDTVSYSTELWEDICEFQLYRAPLHKDDPVWDEMLVNQQALRKFDTLKKLGYFNQKAP
jgi:hypothetical protein